MSIYSINGVRCTHGIIVPNLAVRARFLYSSPMALSGLSPRLRYLVIVEEHQ